MKVKSLYFNIVLGVFGLGLVYFMASSVVPKALVTLTKAAPASKVSLSRSYLLGGKLLAKADGKDNCVINVFALDESGRGVKDKSIELTGMGTQILTQLTGIDGKASFKITSITEGQFKLESSIDGVPLGKIVSVTFRN